MPEELPTVDTAPVIDRDDEVLMKMLDAIYKHFKNRKTDRISGDEMLKLTGLEGVPMRRLLRSIGIKTKELRVSSDPGIPKVYGYRLDQFQDVFNRLFPPDEPQSIVIQDFIDARLHFEKDAQTPTRKIIRAFDFWKERNSATHLQYKDLAEAIFDHQDVTLNESEKVLSGITLVPLVNASDFLARLYFHKAARVGEDKLKDEFLSWCVETNADASFRDVMSLILKKNCSSSLNIWRGVALAESEEDVAVFPPCHVCLQSAWHAVNDTYVCSTCGSTETWVRGTVTQQPIHLNNMHTLLLVRVHNRRHPKASPTVPVHFDKQIVPTRGVEVRLGATISLRGKLMRRQRHIGEQGMHFFTFEVTSTEEHPL